jgi:hypothetical protein
MLNSFPRDIAGGSPPDPGPRDVDFGLVIGVDHDPRFRSLRGAVTDATRFHDWLCAGLYKLEDSSGQAVMFDHGGEAVTRVVF